MMVMRREVPEEEELALQEVAWMVAVAVRREGCLVAPKVKAAGELET